jgi:hypothetical protein
MFYIIFLSLCAFKFLVQSDLNTAYLYLRTELNMDALFSVLFLT